VVIHESSNLFTSSSSHLQILKLVGQQLKLDSNRNRERTKHRSHSVDAAEERRRHVPVDQVQVVEPPFRNVDLHLELVKDERLDVENSGQHHCVVLVVPNKSRGDLHHPLAICANPTLEILNLPKSRLTLEEVRQVGFVVVVEGVSATSLECCWTKKIKNAIDLHRS
jgi:hypothetical protein